MLSQITLHAQPAYGRDYKTQDEVIAAWNAGQDFQLVGQHTYLNNQDAERMGFRVVIVFDNKTQGVAFNDFAAPNISRA